MLFLSACGSDENSTVPIAPSKSNENIHIAPNISTMPKNIEGDMIRYGNELIVNTPRYIGPDGTVGKFTGNKMTCVNCHLDAGTRPFAFNFFSTHGRYPQYRSRENAVLTIEQRVNNCVERPLNGLPLPLDSKEMIAIVSYIKWLGTGVPTGEKVAGYGGKDLIFPDRPADPNKGKTIFQKECALCHGDNGQGKMLADNTRYEFPPLWGAESYQPGSSMFRLIKAAQFIKNNMPNGVTWKNPKLTDEEALDVAAYINNFDHLRPNHGGLDYIDIRTKYVDYPFGPYDDPFSEKQHKFGPFKPIIEYREKNKLYLKY